MGLDIAYIFQTVYKLLPYLWITLRLTLISILFGIVFGLVLAFVKMSKSRIARGIAYGYTTAIRSTPTVVLIFLIYYGLPLLFKALGLNSNLLEKEATVIFIFTLYSSAYLSEVFRSALLAVDAGQREAGISIGMTEAQVFFRIIFTQALVVALPNFGNTLIATLKEISLAFIIGMVDLMGQAQIVNSNSYGMKSLEVYLAAGLLYWGLCFLLEQLMGLCEKICGRYRARVRPAAKGGKIRAV